MPHRDLAEVGARLEEAVASLPEKPADPAAAYDQYEMIAIQILDSEHYETQGLEEYLLRYLADLRTQLGLS